MAIRFTPCPACARHVREGDAACPFCGAGMTRAPAAMVPVGRMSRAALLAAGAAGALAMTDCSSSSGTPLYGGAVPPQESGAPDDSSTSGSSGSAGSSGSGASGGSAGSSGSAQPMYGAVSFPEAGEPSGDATADAAASTDASDAGALEGGEGADGGHMAQPLYGGIAPPYGVPPH